jgi:hypothetical protein
MLRTLFGNLQTAKPTRKEREIERAANKQRREAARTAKLSKACEKFACEGPTLRALERMNAPAATSEETHFRHSWWKAKRDKIIQVMDRFDMPLSMRTNFKNCGGYCIIEWSPTAKRHRLCASYCHNRHCEACMKSKANIIAANLKERLGENKNGDFRFITLTKKHTNTPLKTQIKDLYKSFRKLRNTKAWKRTQHGGAAMLEVKWNPNTRQWHPHLHIISEGIFIDKFELSKLWLKATGDSTIVDIRQLETAKDAAHYVSKYVTKGTNAEVWSDEMIALEWMDAMVGVRTCLTYGKWRGFALTQARDVYTDWKPIGTYTEMLAAARRAEEWAIAVMISICRSEDPEEIRSRFKMDTGDG